MAASSTADPHGEGRNDGRDDGHPARWGDEARRHLLELAYRALHHGVQHRDVLPVDPQMYPPRLRERLAVFVTLFHRESLRGCVGTLEAQMSLVEQTAQSTFAAAFKDPRFEPVTHWELEALSVELSVLDAPEPVTFTDEAHLLTQLRPHVDGLILSHNGRQGTFLPAVWEHLPEPATFLRHLKEKAGLSEAPLPADAVVQRYTVTKICG